MLKQSICWQKGVEPTYSEPYFVFYRFFNLHGSFQLKMIAFSRNSLCPSDMNESLLFKYLICLGLHFVYVSESFWEHSVFSVQCFLATVLACAFAGEKSLVLGQSGSLTRTAENCFILVILSTNEHFRFRFPY